MTPASWAADAMAAARFGDPRRQHRAAVLLTALAEHPESSIPDACGVWSQTKAAYRFFDNETVEPAEILAAHRAATLSRIEQSATILAIQDTTTLDMSSHTAMEGIGLLGQGKRLGLHVHCVLAASPDGVPLGVLDQQVWARDPAAAGSRHQRRTRATADKESQRWLTGVAAAEVDLPADVQIVSVADREADIYDLFALPRRPGHNLLIRAAHDRKVQTDPAAYLWETVRGSPPCDRIELTVPRQPNRPERSAILTLQMAGVTLHPPRPRSHDHTLSPIPMTAILAEEEDPPANEPALCWLLLTTLPIPDAAAARTCLQWYRHRWLIERLHYVLKSGCHIETLQLQTAARLQRALALLTIVAWRLLWLTEQARETPSAPCTTVLTPLQWAALYGTIHRTRVPPPEPVTLALAVRWIAHLGGFLGRTADGDPGVKTIWRGYRRLETICDTWALLQSLPPDPTSG